MTNVLVEIFTTEQYLVLFETFCPDACPSNDNAIQRSMTACKVPGKMFFISSKLKFNQLYSGIPISRTLGFPNLPISRTKPCFPWICFTQALQFHPDFSNPRFLETPNNSNQFWLPWDKLTLDNSNLRKFPNHLVRMSIAFTPLNKLALPDKLFSRILITQQASHKSVISLKGEMTASDCQHSLN